MPRKEADSSHPKVGISSPELKYTIQTYTLYTIAGTITGVMRLVISLHDCDRNMSTRNRIGSHI